jgi:protein AIR1/2
VVFKNKVNVGPKNNFEATPKMASPSQRPEENQATLDYTFFQATNGSNHGMQNTNLLSGLSSTLKKRSAAEVIVLDSSDEDSGSGGPEVRRKRAKTGAVSSASASDHLDDGEIGKPGSSHNPSATTSEAAGPSLKSRHGWNHGVSNGLRISFGAKSQASNPSPGQTAPETIPDETPDTVDTPTSEPSASSESAGVEEWNFPRNNSEWAGRSVKQERWLERFSRWCKDLFKRNSEEDGIWDPDAVRSAWSHWMRTHEPPFRRDAMESAEKAAAAHRLTENALWRRVHSALGPDAVNPRKPIKVRIPREPGEIYGWALPSFRKYPSNRRTEDSKGWQKFFLRWCLSLQERNKIQPLDFSAESQMRVFDAYRIWIDRSGVARKKVSGAIRGMNMCADLLKQAGHESVFAGAASLLHSFDSLEVKAAARQRLPEPIAQEKAGEVTPHLPSPTLPTPNAPVLPHVEEKSGERERYFPGIGRDEVFCVMCTSHTHTVDACPHLICGFCQSADHRTIACGFEKLAPMGYSPSCLHVGHPHDQCPYNRDKVLEPCILCQSSEHLENVCERIWRTYEPEPTRIRKVNSLTAYCYQCGLEGHYGNDCSQRPPRSNPASQTWTAANLLMYLDIESSEEAISASFPSDAVAAPSGRPDFGKSIVPQRHVLFEAADDDDDDAFIRPPVQKAPRPGGISFQTSGDSFVPPLPPGPPPPLPSGPPPSAPQGDNRRNGGKYSNRKKWKKPKRPGMNGTG